MNSKIRNIVLFVSTVFVLLSCAGESKTTPNKDKAEEMFQRVWELYRVPKSVAYEWCLFFGSVDGCYRTGEIYGLCRFDGDGNGALL